MRARFSKSSASSRTRPTQRVWERPIAQSLRTLRKSSFIKLLLRFTVRHWLNWLPSDWSKNCCSVISLNPHLLLNEQELVVVSSVKQVSRRLRTDFTKRLFPSSKTDVSKMLGIQTFLGSFSCWAMSISPTSRFIST
jgi:hypothetical protein